MKLTSRATNALLWFAGAYCVTTVSAKAILGIDLGSLYMKVALVQRGAPLEIVTNLHSKRKTEQMILFDAGSRFFGADANSLLARKPTKTPASMSVMLGRDEDHPAVKILTDYHYPLTPSFNETRSGLCLSITDKEEMSYTPEELVAMVLNHAEEITHAYGGEKGNTYGNIQDCVLTVPSFATQAERQALLDSAALADFNVLSLLDENTAAALHFGMDKLYEEPQLVLFYNLGASSLQVSLVKFHTYEIPESKHSKKMKTVGSIEVLAKAWDSTLGGQAFDNRLVEYLADHFNREWRHAKKHNKDIRDVPRAMTKLRLQANKVKHVLSANQEIPVYMDSLYDDMSLSVHFTRGQFEELCSDLMTRAVAPIDEVLKTANVTLANVTATELIGGGMRIPKIQAELSKALGELELGMHINSDESMALGASFYGANISTAFRVRHVGLTDVNPFAVSVSLENLPEEEKKGFFGGGGNKKKSDGEDEAWSKHATMFKSFGRVGVKKTIAFTHDKDVHCALDYEESEYLPKGSETSLQRYKISGIAEFAKEMEEKGLGKPKISLQFELSDSGITRLIKAEALLEEVYTVEEEVEVEDDKAEDDKAETENVTSEEAADETPEKEEKKEAEDEGKEDAADTNTTEGETDANTTEATKPKKKYIKVQKMFGFRPKNPAFVKQEKKRPHKKTLDVASYHVGKVKPYSDELLSESKAKLGELARKDAERAKLEEARNRVESYIYSIKNKLSDNEEAIAPVSTEEQREELRKLAEDAEEWLYDDGYNADLATMEEKYSELSVPAEKVWFRVQESTARPAAVKALTAKLVKVEELMTKWETTMPQVTEEERGDVLAKVAEVRKWLEEKEEEQAQKAGHEDPAFSSEEVPLQTKALERLVSKLSKKPKPKPEKKKPDENATDANATDTNATDPNATEATEEGASEDGAKEDATGESSTAENATEEETVNDQEL